MIHRESFILVVWLFGLFFSSLQSQILEPKQNLTISDGLEHNGITSFLEDHRGYLWIGTYDGLSRYDGYQLVNYKNTVGKTILVSNRVRTLAEDENHKLWIGTDEGITIYNPSEENFQNLESNNRNHPNSNEPIIRKIIISSDKDFVLCCTENRGILIYNKNFEYVDNVIPNPGTFGSNITFFNGIKLDSDNFFFTSSVGPFLFNISTKKFKRVLSDDIGHCNSVVKTDESSLVVTAQNGIALITCTKDSKGFSFKFMGKRLMNQRYNNSFVDKKDNLWLGTLNNGLEKFDKTALILENNNLEKHIFQLKSAGLRSSCILGGSNDILWYGTFDEGLYRFDINSDPLKKYNTKMNYDLAFSTNNITSISVLDENRAFVATLKGGIGLLNTEKKIFEPLPFSISEADKRYVEAVHVDTNKNIWLYISGKGLFFIKSNTQHMIHVSDQNVRTLRGIRSFDEDHLGNIWIGAMQDTYRVTVLSDDRFNIESLNNNPAFKYNKLTMVRYVYKDPKHDFIWLGTEYAGLIRVRIEREKPISELKVDTYVKDMKRDLSISSNFVSTVIRLPNEELWIGTEGSGICKVLNSDSNPQFITYSENQGLSNNAVKTILYDNDYNLWISTNVGLNKFDTKELRFRKFGLYDGLPFEDFRYSSGKLKNGYLIFSGLDGLCYFKPEELAREEPLPKLEFDDFRIFNKSVTPGATINDRILYHKNLQDRDELILKYNENVFSIKATSLHFSNPESHYLKYRLKPLSNEWLETPSTKQDIYYSGLQPGKYTLEVMASNSLNEWTEPKQLRITITPPYWKTTYAYILYVILTILFIFGITKMFLRIQALNHNLEIEHLEKDQVKQINSAKLKFFSNISHELKTPLTLIKGPVSNLLGEFVHRVDVKEKLQIIERQSKRISQLISQAHDFQKAEAQALKINYSRFSFNGFIQEFSQDFEFMAQNDLKYFIVKDPNENIIISADKDKLEKIFNNILSNSFKYTQEKDTITFSYKSEDKNLIISVSDTGKGIDPEDLSHIFERFYQSHNSENIHTSGSGIGLSFAKLLVEMHYGYINVDSELGRGTTINIRIPVVQMDTESEQILAEEKILKAEKDFEFKSQLSPVNNPQKLEVDTVFSEAVIFYAEDNSDMRAYVSNALKKCFKLKTFNNGKECLDAMEDEWPDIIISDIQMPELNGIDLCRTVKSEIKTSHIPVILLTALTNIDDKLRGIKDGADAYITKPFNVQHLISRTEALLRSRKQLRERFQIGIPLTKENNSNNRNDNAFLEKLYNLIEENLDNQNLDLDSFAKELYLNRTHFFQKVKALTNLTPLEVLKDYRLKKAADFLVNEKVSVKEASVMTGFKSRPHFSKLFKDKYNVAPGRYAKSKLDEYSN